MSLNKFNFRTQSNQLNLIERSKPTLKVGKTLKSLLVCKETPGNQQRTKNESGETNIGLTVVHSLLQKIHFTDPLQPLPAYRSVLSRKTSYQENGNIQQKCKKRSVFLFIVHFQSNICQLKPSNLIKV